MGILAEVNAAAVDVKCVVSNGRSKISVDGSGLRGNFQAKVTSGGISVTSIAQTADPITREVEFDFDSKRADILAGATAIPRNFISNGQVVGSIYAVGNTAPVASVVAICST